MQAANRAEDEDYRENIRYQAELHQLGLPIPFGNVREWDAQMRSEVLEWAKRPQSPWWIGSGMSATSCPSPSGYSDPPPWERDADYWKN